MQHQVPEKTGKNGERFKNELSKILFIYLYLFLLQSWHDIQSRTKTKKGKLIAYTSKTGGGPAVPDLTQSEQKIIELISDTAIRGLEIEVPKIQHIDLDMNAPSTSNPIEHEQSVNNNAFTTVFNSNIQDDHNYANNNLQKKRVQPKEQKKPRNLATQRLEKAIDQSDKTIQLLQEKVTLKQNYFDKKLVLLERDVIAKENISAELKELRQTLTAFCQKIVHRV